MGWTIEARALRLAKQGFTRRKIAKQLGVSYAVACRLLREAGEGDGRKKAKLTQSEDLAMYARPHKRCTHCGKKVQLPCLECQIELDGEIRRAVETWKRNC